MGEVSFQLREGWPFGKGVSKCKPSEFCEFVARGDFPRLSNKIPVFYLLVSVF